MWSANVSTVANTVIPCIIIHASTSEHNFLFFNCDYIIFFHSRLSTTVMSCNAAINSGDDVALRDFSDLYFKNKSTNLQSMFLLPMNLTDELFHFFYINAHNIRKDIY